MGWAVAIEGKKQEATGNRQQTRGKSVEEICEAILF
jgi:hypothetical protein